MLLGYFAIEFWLQRPMAVSPKHLSGWQLLETCLSFHIRSSRPLARARRPEPLHQLVRSSDVCIGQEGFQLSYGALSMLRAGHLPGIRLALERSCSKIVHLLK
eukprot:1749533-Amphidinium_carterae.1